MKFDRINFQPFQVLTAEALNDLQDSLEDAIPENVKAGIFQVNISNIEFDDNDYFYGIPDQPYSAIAQAIEEKQAVQCSLTLPLNDIEVQLIGYLVAYIPSELIAFSIDEVALAAITGDSSSVNILIAIVQIGNDTLAGGQTLQNNKLNFTYSDGSSIIYNPNEPQDEYQVKIPSIDNTLKKSGYAADAKVVGDKITAINTNVTNINSQIDAILGGVTPEELNTLKELSDALNDDASFAATVTTQLSDKATKKELNSIASDVESKHKDAINASTAVQKDLNQFRTETDSNIISLATRVQDLESEIDNLPDAPDLTGYATKGDVASAEENMRQQLSGEVEILNSSISALETDLTNYVPKTRTINKKSLANDVVINASDVGADKEGAAAEVKSYADSVFLPTTATVNGKTFKDNNNAIVISGNDINVTIPHYNKVGVNAITNEPLTNILKTTFNKAEFNTNRNALVLTQANGKELEITVPRAPTHLIDGKYQNGAIRIITAAEENDSYHIGKGAMAMGVKTEASGRGSLALGYQNKTGTDGIAMGVDNSASGSNNSFVGGEKNNVTDSNNFAFGSKLTVAGIDNLAFGRENTVNGSQSAAFGDNNTVSGEAAVAIGSYASANGSASLAIGVGTVANRLAQLAAGQWNEVDDKKEYLHIIGNGMEGARKNIYTLNTDGQGWFNGGVLVGAEKKPVATKSFVQEEDVKLKQSLEDTLTDALSNVAHFKGVFETLPEPDDFTNGDIIQVNDNEYILIGGWQQFGFEEEIEAYARQLSNTNAYIGYPSNGADAPGGGNWQTDKNLTNRITQVETNLSSIRNTATKYIGNFSSLPYEYWMYNHGDIIKCNEKFYICEKNTTPGNVSIKWNPMFVAERLEFTGAVTGSYDGSTATTITIPSVIEAEGSIINIRNGSGQGSLIQNNNNQAEGLNSVAFGNNNAVSGNNSQAYGNNLIINQANLTSIGEYNIPFSSKYYTAVGTLYNQPYPKAQVYTIVQGTPVADLENGIWIYESYQEVTGAELKVGDLIRDADNFYTELTDFVSEDDVNQYFKDKRYRFELSNKKISPYIFSLGNGSSSQRSNALIIDRNGNARFSGDIYVQGTGTTGLLSDAKILATQDYVNIELDSYVTKVDLNSTLENYSTKTYADNLVSSMLNSYATTDYVNNTVANIDLSGYALKTQVPTNLTNGSSEGSIQLVKAKSDIGQYAVALGFNTKASGDYSICLGYYGEATGKYSTALNYGAASGEHAVALGGTASGDYSTALTIGAEASGLGAVALGEGVEARGEYQLVFGKYNAVDIDNKYALLVGMGTTTHAGAQRITRNGFAIDWQGNVWINGRLEIRELALANKGIVYVDDEGYLRVEPTFVSYMQGGNENAENPTMVLPIDSTGRWNIA